MRSALEILQFWYLELEESCLLFFASYAFKSLHSQGIQIDCKLEMRFLGTLKLFERKPVAVVLLAVKLQEVTPLEKSNNTWYL